MVEQPTAQQGGSSADTAGVESQNAVSPFEFWALNSTQMFFEEDVADVAGARLKLNNVAAMAQGIRLLTLASSKKDDPELLQHFRSLAARLFESCLQSNPTNSLALREYAVVLLDQEAARSKKGDWKTKGSLVSVFWSSRMRYVDFLFRIALESNPFDSECIYYYALFVNAGGRSPLWLLLRAVLCDHENTKALSMLREQLEQSVGPNGKDLLFSKELKMLTLWASTPVAGHTNSPPKKDH
jgi:hypothetical protein